MKLRRNLIKRQQHIAYFCGDTDYEFVNKKHKQNVLSNTNKKKQKQKMPNADVTDVVKAPKSKKNLYIGIAVFVGICVAVGLGLLLWKAFGEKSSATPPNTPPIGALQQGTSPGPSPGPQQGTQQQQQETDPPPAFQGVRYIRVQRVRPSLQNENTINLSEIQVYNNGTQIPLVAGTVYNQNAQNGWENVKDGLTTGYVGFAETTNDPNSYILVDLGAAKTVDQVIVWNRAGGLGWNRIIGCELQLLNEAQGIIQRWDFASVANIATNNAVQTTGAESYMVSASNKTLVARGMPPPPPPAAVSTAMSTIPIIANVPGIAGVRYIRVQRVRPSPTQNGNQINLSGIQVFSNGAQIPLVGGLVHEPLGGNYGWENLKNGWRDGGIAHTTALADASITVDLGAATNIDQITVYNRVGVGLFLIVGCELQVLNEAQTIIQKWDFPTTPAAGAPSYTVGKATQMNLVVGIPS